MTVKPELIEVHLLGILKKRFMFLQVFNHLHLEDHINNAFLPHCNLQDVKSSLDPDGASSLPSSTS